MDKKYFCARSYCFIGLTLIIGVMYGCTEDTGPSATPTIDYGSIAVINYSEHVQPLLSRSCAASSCHDAATKAAGLDLGSWNALIRGSSFGEVLVPFDTLRSLLVNLFDVTPLRKGHPAFSSVPFSTEEVSFLKRWIREGARNDASVVPYATSPHKLYVPNQADDNVAIIDIDNLVVRRYVNVGNMPTNDAPHFVVANSQYWYVSLIGTGQVWKFDARTDTLVGVVNITGSPAILELTHDGSKLYVSQFTTGATNRVTVVNTASMTVATTIQVWTMPHGMRLNRAGTILYVANMMSDNISVIDVATDQVLSTIPLASDAIPFGPPKYMPMEMAVSPDESVIAVTCSEQREVRFFSTSSLALVDSFAVGDQPWHLQFTPDGEYCYVANRRGHTTSVIHVPSRQVTTTYTAPTVFSNPHGCDVSADGRFVFISNENVFHGYVPRYSMEFVGNVTIIDNTTSQIVKVLEVGKMPTGLSVAQ
ncbi:MAG TPA: beta-propeller fold lactonase family protein [Bacteroidota bacterium]